MSAKSAKNTTKSEQEYFGNKPAAESILPNPAYLRPNVLRETPQDVEYRKANVLTYLNAAWQQLGQAQLMLAPKTELWNQIHRMDSDIEDMMDELKEGGYDKDSLSVQR